MQLIYTVVLKMAIFGEQLCVEAGFNFYMKRFLTLGLLIYTIATFAQQGPQTSLAIFNPYLEHAAMGGMDRRLSIVGQVRSQWTGIGQGPSTQYIGANMPMYAWTGAIGADLFTHRSGNLRINQLRASYNYVTPGFGGLLSVGGRLGFNQISLDGSRIITPDGNYDDGAINHNDPTLANTIVNSFGVNWEVSAAFTNNLITAALSFSDLVSPQQSIAKGKFQFDRTVNGLIRYDYQLNEDIVLMPNLGFRTNLRVLQTDVGVMARYKVRTFGGLLLRGYNTTTIDALAFTMGYHLSEKFSLYYSYETGLSALKTVNEGTHDFMMKIRLEPLFGKNLPPKIIYNPRFL